MSQRKILTSGLSAKAMKGLAEVALLSLNLVTITRRQCSRSAWLDLEWLCGFAKALLTFGNPSQRFLWVSGIFPKSLKSSLRKTEHFLGFLAQVQVSSTWLDLDWLCGFIKASLTFENPSQRFLWVPRISLKTSESSLRWPEHSFSFLCNLQIDLFVPYKYEALPLQNIFFFISNLLVFRLCDKFSLWSINLKHYSCLQR